MGANSANHLEVARDHYNAGRLVEAYHAFRRFFDRLPFRIEKEHAEYIGMFVRTLSELGKSNELNFYVSALERHYQTDPDPLIAYPLAVVYRSLPDPRQESARRLFEEVIRASSTPESYRTRARMMLAHYYDWKYKDVASCRRLIDSVEPPEEAELRALWLIWKAKVLKDESRFSEAGEVLSQVEAFVTWESDWYGYFCARVIRASLLLAMDRVTEADEVVREVRELFGKRQFKSLKMQLDDLERRVREKSDLGVLQYVPEGEGIRYVYENRVLTLKKESPAERLLRALIRKGCLDKDLIMRTLYDRPYEGADDDRLIYYHIHSLRKRLRALGLPEGGIVHETKGYRLIPRAERLGVNA